MHNEFLDRRDHMANIVLYTKAYCPYCKAAKALLEQKGLTYTEIDVANDHKALKEMFKRSNNRRTVPQIFFGNRHIGGYSDLAELNQIEDIAKTAA